MLDIGCPATYFQTLNDETW